MKDVPATTTAGGRVLLVDDDGELVRGFARLLTASGHRVETAPDGQAGALFAAGGFDVIVSDIHMPALDGIGLLRAVREHDLDVPIVLMTADPSVDTASRAMEFGAFRYLSKPVDSQRLRQVVDEAVRAHRMALLKREALSYFDLAGMQIGDRAGLEVRFANGLSSLWMAYQPIVSWSKKEVIGFEALVRTSEPAIPHPGALLDAAEKLKRLFDLGRAIRASVADTVKLTSEASDVFVNLHPMDLMDEQLYLSESPLSAIAGRIVLEITERASLDGVKDVPTRIVQLRELGFRLAIDDLGAGYAGLASFAQLEPDVVKLDMSLVRNVHREKIKQRLVRSMVSVSVDMGIVAIAEGVEVAEERDMLVELGCDLFQGYLFARPAKPFPRAIF